jgi:hypothetical protein
MEPSLEERLRGVIRLKQQERVSRKGSKNFDFGYGKRGGGVERRNAGAFRYGDEAAFRKGGAFRYGGGGRAGGAVT